MQFFPKKFKFKKQQKGALKNKRSILFNIKNKTTKSIKLLSSEHGKLSTKQFLAIRFLIRKIIKKKGISIFRVSPQTIVTKKPSGIRMGKGKGTISHWIAKIEPGTILCEIFQKIRFTKRIHKALKKVQIRLPIKTRIL